MSGMFYSLEEAAQKLNKSKDEIKKLVKEGQLREFRDGPNVLFKADEVEALKPEAEISGPSEADEPVEIAEDKIEIPELIAEEPDEPTEEYIPEETLPEESAELELKPDEQPADSEEMPDFNIETSVEEVPEEVIESEEASSQEPAKANDEDLDSVLLGQENETPAAENDLTDGDTALPGQGTSILGQTDNKEYELTDDTMADTVITEGTKGSSIVEGLEEAEEDVNLDSFGSGSGLLDLSLQADDTSLGGILDEIYTDENKAPGAKAGKAEVSEEAEAGISEEAGEAAPAGIGEEAITPQLAGEGEVTMQAGLVAAQVSPDSQSNILGMLLFIPIALVIYTVIVALSGIRGILPSILTMIQIWVWPIMGALGLVSLVVIVAAFMLTGDRSAAPKEKKIKVKKEKPPKVKKVKAEKPKKEKPPKEEKKGDKKEKKKFFRLK